MRKLGLVVVLLVACSGGPGLPRAAQGTPLLEVRGAVKEGPFALGRADLEKLPRRGVHGVDPVSRREALWEGTSVAEILSRRVELQKGADVAIVRTADRSAIPIPLTVIRQLKPVLADRADGTHLPSTVLAWPTLEQRGLETDPRAGLWWARDVVAFEIADWQKTFGAALATPDGAADGARRGSGWYGERCISCHRMRGVGGDRGPDLTSVASRIRPAPFAALLQKHPGWTGTGGDPPGEEGISELWAFLRAVAAAGPAGPADALTAERGAPAPSAR
jgi:mono/diheme cytochrome c family protein